MKASHSFFLITKTKCLSLACETFARSGLTHQVHFVLHCSPCSHLPFSTSCTQLTPRSLSLLTAPPARELQPAPGCQGLVPSGRSERSFLLEADSDLFPQTAAPPPFGVIFAPSPFLQELGLSAPLFLLPPSTVFCT